ncbi:nuclear transport factor 2 family protein [Kineosporia sp. J2-2]|uniref:Nuclear transport factor 2 family protein n=1 Tax=Kineosporia corallincola TaxID=2835133 RepID=A0ABS5TP90_9ACTN|nr:nuclear transport factor 2 family protein [Kineosporia corallincola]MBT0772902.1 nuclear transport factor 2 family protein [Kineosporia corallincola]
MSRSPVTVAVGATRDAILQVEKRRCEALIAGDLATLEDLYDDSLVHTHAPGLTHDKAQLLEHVAIRRAYREITRGELTIRLIGDVAIVTGRITNRLAGPDGGERVLAGPAIQVLRLCDDGAWRFVSFQMTTDGELAFPPTEAEKAGLAGTSIRQRGEKA